MCANGSVMIKLMLSNELHGKTKCGKWGIPLRGKSRILYAEADISYYLRQWNASSKSMFLSLIFPFEWFYGQSKAKYHRTLNGKRILHQQLLSW